MTTEELLTKRTATETRFNELINQRKQIEEELLKLQGEYRAYSDLINSSKPEEANTIVAEPKRSKKNGK